MLARAAISPLLAPLLGPATLSRMAESLASARSSRAYHKNVVEHYEVWLCGVIGRIP